MIEILYHTLWETVHVFFEHRELGHDVGASGFLYPFLGQEKQETGDLVAEVAASILMKVQDDAKLRAQVAHEEAEQIGNAALAIHERLRRGGKLIIFGNGGSATDANDWAIDCVLPPAGYQSVPAVSLSLEPANITAVANDIGTDVIFLRQLIAQARPEDVAIGISTSGGSRNIIMALEEARKRNLLTVALLGYDGGEIKRKRLADFPLVVHCDYIPAHSGSAGFDLSRHPRIVASAEPEVLRPWPSLNSTEPRAVPHTSEMREWLEWKRSDFVEYDVEADPAARGRMREISGGQRTRADPGRRRQGRPGRLARPRLHRRRVADECRQCSG